MTTARREEILRAEESIRALANELAATQMARTIHEESSAALRSALEDVSAACSSLERLQAELRQDAQGIRKEVLAASDDLGAATDHAHERLKETVETFSAVSRQIEARSVEQAEELRRLRASIVDEIRVFDRNFERLGDQFREYKQHSDATKASIEGSLAETREQVRELEAKISHQGRRMIAGMAAVLVISTIVLLTLVLT